MRTTHALTPALLLGALAIVGCQGQGKHTQQFKQEATARMNAVKAATQWDMAHQQFLAGDLDKALRTLDNSITIRDDVSKSHRLRGRIMLELDRMERAIASFERAATLDPTDPEPRYYLGIVHERLSDPEAALGYFDEALALDDQNPQYVLAGAEMLIALDRLDEADARLSSASSTFEHNAGVRQTRGHIAMMRGDAEAAVRHFNEACLLGPDDLGLFEDLARAQVDAGDIAGAEYTFRRLLAQSDNERPDIERQLVACLIQLDRPVEARKLLLKRVRSEAGASDVNAWIELGGVCLRLGDRFRLREAGRRVTALAPERTDGYMLTSWWHHLEGRTGKAIDVLDRAGRVTGAVSDVAILQSLIYRDAGDSAAAMGVLERVRKADPHNAVAAALAREIHAEHAVADVPLD